MTLVDENADLLSNVVGVFAGLTAKEPVPVQELLLCAENVVFCPDIVIALSAACTLNVRVDAVVPPPPPPPQATSRDVVARIASALTEGQK